MLDLVLRHGKRIPIICDMVFSILIFSSAFAVLDEIIDNTEAGNHTLLICIAALYVNMALVHVFRAFRLRERSKSAFIAHLVYCILFVLCAAAVMILGINGSTRTVISVIFWATLIAERLLFAVRRHKVLNIVFTVIVVLALMALLTTSFYEFSIIFVAFGAAAGALLSILNVSLSQIRFDILKDILRKTYALEIICGLVLTMIAFSYLLELADDSFDSFWDALWYCFAVVTTIGFGDISPSGIVGRVLSMILGVYGIIVVALITSIIVNFYGEMKRIDTGKTAVGTEPPDDEPPE